MFKHNHPDEDDRLISLGLSVRAYNYCIRYGLNSISSLLAYYQSNGHSIPPGINAGKTTIEELTSVCKTLLSSPSPLSDNISKDTGIKSWSLSTRAYNFCQSLRLTTKKDLVSFYLLNNCSIPPQANAGKKTTNEIMKLCVRFLKEDPSIVEAAKIQARDNNIDFISDIFDLSIEDKSFLTLFLHDNKHIPALWLISKLINKNSDSFCFAYAYGIDYIRGRKSVAELAEKLNVTITRVGQRVINGYKVLFHLSGTQQNFNDYRQYLPKIFCSLNIKYLEDHISKYDVICSDDPISKVADLNTLENTNFSCAFILRLISSLSDKYICIGDFERNRPDPDITLINKNISRIFNFAKFDQTFCQMIKGLTENTTLNIREYVEDSSCWIEYSSVNVDRVLRACKQIILSRYEILDEDGDDIYNIYPQKIDVGAVVFSIISAAGYPLTLSEILCDAEQQYPTKNFTEEAIRIAIRNDNRIQYKRDGGGKTKYLLANADVPTSVRDAIVRVLDGSEIPVKLDDIVDYVMLHFPSSSKSSVRTTMLNDGRSRFVQFSDARFGLSSKEYSPEFEVIADVARVSYDERVIELKNFLHDKKDFPSAIYGSPEEASLARWVDRNSDRQEVSELIATYNPIIWDAQCKLCEKHIIAHSGRLPSKVKYPKLFAWLMKAAEDFNDGFLTQSQKKSYLHLKMVIVKSHA